MPTITGEDIDVNLEEKCDSKPDKELLVDCAGKECTFNGTTPESPQFIAFYNYYCALEDRKYKTGSYKLTGQQNDHVCGPYLVRGEFKPEQISCDSSCKNSCKQIINSITCQSKC